MKLDSRVPVRIDRPLRGGHLIALNGCCTQSAHAWAALSIGGGLVNAQRFAIRARAGHPAAWQGRGYG